MSAIPSHIIDFIQSHHIVSFATHTHEDFWVANCFYAFDIANNQLIILSSKKTRHSRLMQQNPHIVGTISTQTETLSDIEGIQFSAKAYCLENELEKEKALHIYYQRHPIARLKPSDVWVLRFEMIKHTSNKVLFAQKTIWEK
ncbi:hypothetical protein [Actinobacillus arthritidis]|uniref:hypothetical protein n=1 Tax=Actinobacillus arthritidis TaxID=157339 RepID=UPI002441C67E|nr:hypothetical protein [Actinobacillus arthritidis]WGE89906.1 hypothetical protein NYR89_03190 [Actinobacillus arthritidis]